MVRLAIGRFLWFMWLIGSDVCEAGSPQGERERGSLRGFASKIS